MTNRTTAQLLIAALLTVTAAGVARAQSSSTPRGRFSLNPYLTLGDGSWSKSYIDPVNGGPINTLQGGGNGFGLRLGYLLTPIIGLWASGDGAIAFEGGYWSVLGGLKLMAPVGSRATIGGRAGAGRLDEAPFGMVAIDGEVFLARRLSITASGEYTFPIGDGREDTGFGIVDVKRDGGPRRLQLGLAWYP